jgi:molecular chaperone GrpE
MGSHETEFDPERVVVRDKRRLDPTSGELREPAAGVPAPAPADPAAEEAGEEQLADELSADLQRVTAELTGDLQRVTAEYANYRKRVDRDRALVVETATAALLAELLPLLDDVERARQHGDLDGAFKSVGEGIEAVAGKLGLERFGEVGEPFDPAVHEALMQAEPDPTAEVPTCAQVLQPGYRLTSGRVLRPARVAVAEPGASAVPE